MTAFVDSSFLGLLLVLFALQRPETLAASGLLCALYAVVRSNLLSIDIGFLVSSLSITLLLMIGVGLGLTHGFSSIFYIFNTTSALYAAKRFGSLSLRHVRMCLQIVFWAAILGIAIGLALYWDAAEPLGEIIPGSSTNGLPSYLIVLQVALAITVFLEKDRLPVPSAIATLLVALFGLGRGSIVIAALVVLFVSLMNIFLGRKNEDKQLFAEGVWGVSLLAFAAGIYLWHFFTAVDIPHSKWAVWGLTDPSRAKMLQDYIGKLDAFSMWFGTDYSGTSIAEQYAGSPHNSFVRLHSYFGLFGLLLVLASPFVILALDTYFYIKTTVLFLVLFVLVRATTEPILFPTALDFLYFLYFVVLWKHAPSRCSFGRATC